MSFGAHTGSQRTVGWNFARHSFRCSLIVLLWSHCNSCINLQRKNHCCRDELCSGSCAEPQPSMDVEQHPSPQMEHVQCRWELWTLKVTSMQAFNTLLGGLCEGRLMVFSPEILLLSTEQQRWLKCMYTWSGCVLPGCGVHYRDGAWLVG